MRFQVTPAFSVRDLLGWILRSLGFEVSKGDQSKLARYNRLQGVAEQLETQGRHLVLLFDEAQEMPVQTLNELKLLTNLNGGGHNYLTILLLGQPELLDRISKMPALDQRISLRTHLHPFDLPNTKAYLEHRLKMAGHPNGRLFTDGAIQSANEASRGIPRELNRIAKLSLEVAWLYEFPLVTKAAVDAVVEDLQRHQKRHSL